jgi:hypothetical protein
METNSDNVKAEAVSNFEELVTLRGGTTKLI